MLGQYRRHYCRRRTENDFIVDGWRRGIYTYIINYIYYIIYCSCSGGMVTRWPLGGGGRVTKNRGRNIALVFQPFEHTNTFNPDSFGNPIAFHRRILDDKCTRLSLGVRCCSVYIYYISYTEKDRNLWYTHAFSCDVTVVIIAHFLLSSVGIR